MPKSGRPANSAQDTDLSSVAHHPVLADVLRINQQHCDFYAAALGCTAFGLRVHPLKIRGKTPILKGWQDKATTEAAPLQQWAQDYPHANAGIVAGAPSGVIIVDMDVRGGANASLDHLKCQYGELPLSWEVLTPGGRHLYLRHPGGQVRTYRLAPGVEVLGDGANAVAPGSIHPGGDTYRWNPFLHPDVQPLAEAPEWLLNLLKQKRIWTPGGEVRPQMYQVDLLASEARLPEELGQAGALSGELVKSLYAQEWVIQKILPLLGLGHVKIGEKFRCVLHQEEHPSAAIMRPEQPGDSYTYVDFHEREKRKGFALPLVYYRLKAGKEGEDVERLPAPSFLVWSLRLLRDAGVIEAVKLEAARLPENASEAVRRVYEGFRDLLSLKFLVDANNPSPYTWRFAQAWVGLSRRAVEKAMGWLLSRGYIRFIKYYNGEGVAGRIMLFLLGTRQLIRRRAGTALVAGGQAEVVEAVAIDIEAVYQENRVKEVQRQVSRFCKRCGEVWAWWTYGEIVVCQGCFGMMDTG
jgi:bifunctional DNA primase/polymerase-like protein